MQIALPEATPAADSLTPNFANSQLIVNGKWCGDGGDYIVLTCNVCGKTASDKTRFVQVKSAAEVPCAWYQNIIIGVYSRVTCTIHVLRCGSSE